jgi:hypothetical protein
MWEQWEQRVRSLRMTVREYHRGPVSSRYTVYWSGSVRTSVLNFGLCEAGDGQARNQPPNLFELPMASMCGAMRAAVRDIPEGMAVAFVEDNNNMGLEADAEQHDYKVGNIGLEVEADTGEEHIG